MAQPDATVARQVTGYERGTITPLGSTTAWPVITDERVLGREITLGAGEHGVAVAVRAGLISGTPTTVQSVSVTVTAKDKTGAHGSVTFTWTIAS